MNYNSNKYIFKIDQRPLPFEDSWTYIQKTYYPHRELCTNPLNHSPPILQLHPSKTQSGDPVGKQKLQQHLASH